jgi:hypothetical protein
MPSDMLCFFDRNQGRGKISIRVLGNLEIYGIIENKIREENMQGKKEVKKKLVNARLLKNYGSWMYCGTCGNAVGYLCYSTYDYFKFNFTCSCGEHGSFELGEDKGAVNAKEVDQLAVKKGRLCCPHDQAPLFSIVDKNLQSCDYKVICKECSGSYHAKVRSQQCCPIETIQTL